MSATIEVQDIQGMVEGLADFELPNSPRQRPLTYTLTLPADCTPEKPAKGLVFYIPGFGEDNNTEYVGKIRRFLAETYNLASATVDYHAIQARPEQGARLFIDEEGSQFLQLLSHKYGVTSDNKSIHEYLFDLGAKLPAATKVSGALQLPNGEYQNFGMLQALDYLTVINDLISENVPFDHNNIILVGSSHGGYIAHLICKIAPNTINAVIDNSSYIKTGWTYMGVHPECYFAFGNLMLTCNVDTKWQLKDREEPTFFGLAQQLMREVSFPPHLEEIKRNSERLPQYFCFNSIIDGISPLTEKRLQRDRLRAIGCECELKEVTEADIDGKMFKTLDHGLNASMKSICQLIMPKIQPRPTTLDRFRHTVLEFDCYDQRYRFEHTEEAPWIHANLLPPK